MNLSSQKKLNKYRNNEILDSIIEKTISKNSIDAENVEPKRDMMSVFSSFFKSDKKISKNMILKNKIPEKYIKSINPSSILEFQPYLSNNISRYNQIEIDMSGRKSSGSFGAVYLNIKSKNREPINNIIFKIIKDAENEFKSLIFHYLLQKYYENKDKDKLKYLCKLYEFGTIDYPVDKISYYAIMENCGKDLYDYFYDTKKNKSMCLKDRLIKLITIFKECCNAVKVIHDLEYLHLDIKLENFMISNEGQIKIIDFGFVKKNGYETIDRFGTMFYTANDWLINFSLSVKTTLQYHHDIFSLGCMFIELLYNYVFQKNIFMTCPIYQTNISINEIYSFRKNYNSSLQDIKIKDELKKKLLPPKNRSSILTKYFITKYIKNKSTENFINDLCLLISFMVNSDPEKRYEKIDAVITHLNYLNL